MKIFSLLGSLLGIVLWQLGALCTICAMFVNTPSCMAQTITLTSPPNGGNQKSSVTQWIGLASVTITYHGPDVHDPQGKDRKGHIWGELVPYGLQDPGFGTSLAAPWRTGSNEITTVAVSHDVKINGSNLKAGVYGLFLLLDKEKSWTWIFSKNSTSWGSYYYTPDEDVLRVEAKPEECAYTEWLTFGFDDRQGSSVTAYLQWENKRISFKVDVPNATQLYVEQMRAELTSYAGFNPANWLNCARFCLNNKTNLEEALKWVNISMDTKRFNGQKSFLAMQTKSDILTLLNRSAEAETLMNEAMNTASVAEIHQYGRSLLAAGKNERALEVFKLNRQRHKEDTFTTFVGLARGYAALGNKNEAIKNWETALKNVPEEQKANIPTFEAELKKLRQ
jgi:tetratricopeptide (TPR) repeat protein